MKDPLFKLIAVQLEETGSMRPMPAYETGKYQQKKVACRVSVRVRDIKDIEPGPVQSVRCL